MQRLIIGIGGGIGSGKSSIARIFSVMGFPVFDSDIHAKKLYLNHEIKKKVIYLLGDKAYDEHGKAERNYIASVVFQNPKLLDSLNQIIHPAVKNDFEIWCNNYPVSTPVIKESALLFELGLHKECTFSIMVDAEKKIRIARVMKRDGVTAESVDSRINNQKDPKLYYKEADLLILNDNSTLITPMLLNWIEKLYNQKNK